jgi:hypothetical protein
MRKLLAAKCLALLLLCSVSQLGQLQAAPPIQTLFVIALENHNWTLTGGSTTQIKGSTAAPYINSLINPLNSNSAQVSYADAYYAAGNAVHPSEPNYIWAEAGTNYNPTSSTSVLADLDPSLANGNLFVSVPHLTAQMNTAGVSWKNYQEDYQILNSTTPTGGSPLVSKSGTSSTVTNPYYGTKQYDYAPKHNPMAFFSDTQTQNVGTLAQLSTDLTNNTVGRYNWITPNQFNDMHSVLSTGFTYNSVVYSGGSQQAIAQGDRFLSIVIPQIMATTAYQNNGAIIIWFDETIGSDTTSATIPEIVISPLAKGNAYHNVIPYNHSSDILTAEEIFQLGGTLNNLIPTSEYSAFGPGNLNAVRTANDLSDLFQSGAIPSTVPEPSSLALFGIGMVALAFLRSMTGYPQAIS